MSSPKHLRWSHNQQTLGEDTPREEESGPSELDQLREELASLHQRLEQPDATQATKTISAAGRRWQASTCRETCKNSKSRHAKQPAKPIPGRRLGSFFREGQQEREKITSLTDQPTPDERGVWLLRQTNQRIAGRKTQPGIRAGSTQNRSQNSRKDIAKLRKILADWRQSRNEWKSQSTKDSSIWWSHYQSIPINPWNVYNLMREAETKRPTAAKRQPKIDEAIRVLTAAFQLLNKPLPADEKLDPLREPASPRRGPYKK